ncbi:MAG: hypothetical protein L3J82_10875 [Planctomycetes bacterium]|nr:hypothetical protein [Planctomycetota bacterium]
MRHLLFLLVPVLLMVLAVSTDAETIYLKSGSKLVGKVLDEKDGKVRIEVKTETGKAVITIKRSRIERIETGDSFDNQLKNAQGFLATERWRDAEAGFRALARIEPTDALVRKGLAAALWGRYKSAEAIKTLENYLLLVRTNRDASLMLQLAEYHMYAKEYRDARKIAREAAALYPENSALQAEVKTFTKRIDRVKSGAEALKKRKTEAEAARDEAVKQRSEYDRKRANCWDIQQNVDKLKAWTSQSDPTLILEDYAELGVQDNYLRAYLNGGSEADFRKLVSRCEVKLTVDTVAWNELWDHEKSIILYGWFYQLDQIYPRCNPVITIQGEVEDSRKKKMKKLARGSWDGRRDRVNVDRWTKERRDPRRGIPRRINNR